MVNKKILEKLQKESEFHGQYSFHEDVDEKNWKKRIFPRIHLGRIILQTISNELRLNIMNYLIVHREGINIKELAEKINRYYPEKFDYKAFVYHLKFLEDIDFVTLEKKENERGRPVIVKPTESLTPIYLVWEADDKLKKRKLPIVYDSNLDPITKKYALKDNNTK